MSSVAAGGVGTVARRGLGAALAAAVTSVVADPGLWLLGAVSFFVRGGALVILLPILWVPSPVLMSVFLAPFITTSGISPDVVPVAVSAAIAVIVAAVAAVVLAGYVQLAAFERIAGRNETDALRFGHQPRTLHNGERLGIVVRLAVIQLLGLVPALLLLPTIGQHIGDAGLAELQLPTSTDTPLVIAILQRVQSDLLLLGFVIVVMDLLVALGGHQLIAARLGLADPRGSGKPTGDLRAIGSGLGRLIRQPVRTALLFVLAWLVTVGAVAVAIGATVIAWGALRELLFQPTSAAPASAEIAFIAELFALAAFGAIWIASITLAGFASSLRGALWTTNALR